MTDFYTGMKKTDKVNYGGKIMTVAAVRKHEAKQIKKHYADVKKITAMYKRIDHLKYILGNGGINGKQFTPLMEKKYMRELKSLQHKINNMR